MVVSPRRTGHAPAMQDRSALPVLQAARARIAANGLRGLRLRSVAHDAGTSLGSINYRIGDKASLIARLIEEEQTQARAARVAWQARMAALDLTAPAMLAEIITGYLDQSADRRREAAITSCELLLEAGLDPPAFPGMAGLLDEEEAFWADALKRDHGTRAPVLAWAVANYCRDELPFTIAANGDADYRLLRAAVARRVAAGLSGEGDSLTGQFEALVAGCGATGASTPLPVDLPPGSKKAELAQHIASIIAEQGVASVTHRLVAARAGVPNSSVAHHFRTLGDVLQAGIGALILSARRELGASEDQDRRDGIALLRATHSIALAAARDQALVPFALDMRRRRAENVRAAIGRAIAPGTGLDPAAVQAAVMVMIGASFAARATPRNNLTEAGLIEQLGRLRGGTDGSAAARHAERGDG